MIAPCKDCGEREIGCHGRCAAYAEYHAENERRRKMRMAEAETRMEREGMRKNKVKKASRRRQWREK